MSQSCTFFKMKSEFTDVFHVVRGPDVFSFIETENPKIITTAGYKKESHRIRCCYIFVFHISKLFGNKISGNSALFPKRGRLKPLQS